MRAIIVIGIIIFIFIILLNIPVNISISYRETLEISMKYAFFKLGMPFDRDEKEKSKKKIRSKKRKSKKVKEKKKLKFTYDIIMIILNNLPRAGKKISKLLSKIVLDNIYLYLRVSGNDAYDTSIKYGKITAWVFGIYATLDNIFKVKKVHFQIEPDYMLNGSHFEGAVNVKIRPVVIFGGMVSLGWVFVSTLMQIQKYNRNLDKKLGDAVLKGTPKTTVG